MNIIVMRVPSARGICTPINRTLRKFGLPIKAYSSAPPAADKKPPRVEHLPCPIEPTTTDRLWLVVPDDANIADLLEQTFLNADFVTSIMNLSKNADDMLAMECLVAACSARKIALSYTGAGSTQKLYKLARAEGTNQTRQHLAEHVLAIPSLLELLLAFVEYLLSEAGLLLLPHQPIYA
jgi:hypothetical protein